MATASAGRSSTVRAKKPAVPAWHKLAQPTARKRALWERSPSPGWVACGEQWDAVAITPMHVGPKSGYSVLADHLRGVLYVMVAPGTGDAFADIPGVRVLSRGHQLLMPPTQHGTAVTDWVSFPREDPPVLLRADRLATHLRELTSDHERTAAS